MTQFSSGATGPDPSPHIARDESASPLGLGAAARKGARFGAASATVTQVLSFLTTLVLVRILDPHDFGLVAGANSVVLVASTFTRVGVGEAIVKGPRPDEARRSTLFWVAT